MRENRPYGSEGGGIEINRSSLPLSGRRWLPAQWHLVHFCFVITLVISVFFF
jgi:hypothetical protein